ncbi:Ribokinase-like protein [Xylaria palmicola]|nr:Ribokinase-like protein [Xylaria palmicola]
MAAAKEFPLLCLENPLLDIQAVGNEELLNKYGLKANDAILAEEKHIPLYEELLNNYDAKLIAGGAAQNTARGAQYMLAPNSVVYLGGVGDDKYAAILRDAVKQVGLRVEYRVDPKTPTGRCGAIITGVNRSLCTDLAAANLYDLDHLKSPEVWKLAENADFYYVGGFHFTVCPPAIMALSPYWDYIVCNETEAASWASSHDLAHIAEDIPAVARALANLPKKNAQRPRVAVVTQGTNPTLVAVQGQDGVKEYPVHAIGADKINDTNGAGDAFAGGFVAGLVQGKDIDAAVDMGQWLAALSIQELGPS